MTLIKKYSIFFLLTSFLGCNKKNESISKNPRNLKNTTKIIENECEKPMLMFHRTPKNIKLIYQKFNCRIDTFSINPQMKVGNLMDSLKSYFDINEKKRLKEIAKKIKLNNDIEFVSKDFLLIMPNSLPKDIKGSGKSAYESFWTSLASEIIKKRNEFMINKQYTEGNSFLQSMMRVSVEGTFFRDSIAYKSNLKSFLNSLSDEKIPLKIYMRNNNLLKYGEYISDKNVKLSKYDILMISTRSKTLSELGIKEFDVIHYFSVSFLLE